MLDAGVGMLSLKEIARYAEESSVQPVPSSLVTKYQGNAHNVPIRLRRRPVCKNQLVFQEVNGNAAWRWVAKPCDRWTCESCYSWRVETELIPELYEALEWAKELGITLKFLTLTWQSSDVAGRLDSAGAKRRRLDLQHFAQRLRRLGHIFEYLKVVETHKSGKVHVHLAVMMPFLPQKFLSEAWRKATRGTSRVIDIRAMSAKCPRCWPGPGAAKADKKLSMIIPPPGSGKCGCCGFEPNWQSVDVGMDVAREISKEVVKYLSKELAVEGVVKNKVKKLTRSGKWKARCVQKGEKEPVEICDHCESVHIWRFVGRQSKLIDEGFGGVEDFVSGYDVAYYPNGKEPGSCWGDQMVWLESSEDSWMVGLNDHRGLPMSAIVFGDDG